MVISKKFRPSLAEKAQNDGSGQDKRLFYFNNEPPSLRGRTFSGLKRIVIAKNNADGFPEN